MLFQSRSTILYRNSVCDSILPPKKVAAFCEIVDGLVFLFGFFLRGCGETLREMLTNITETFF